MTPFPVFIGYDPREAVAYHVCCQSIIENSSIQVAFIPVTGERRDGSNAFIYERFLVPHMMRFQGRALFIDGDMIVRGDIAELVDHGCPRTGVSVVKHDYKTKYPVKYLGNKNEDYPRKNWSSVVLWDCGFYPNRVLTPEFVAKQPGSYLHRFSWLADDMIGSLPAAWNRLVLEQPIDPDDRLLHYTVGTPCFSEYADCEGAAEWYSIFNKAITPISTDLPNEG